MSLWGTSLSIVQPALMIKDIDAVWSGSTLASIVNSGTDGGSWTIAGVPDKGTAIGAYDPIRFNADTEVLQRTFDFLNSGQISFFTYGRLITAGINGVINRSWNTGDDRFVYYSNTSGAGAGAAILRQNSAATNQPPSWEKAADGQFQTAASINAVYGQGGTTIDAWVDGTQQTLTGTSFGSSFPLIGAAPDYPSSVWEFGRGDPTPAEGAKSEFLCIALFTQWLPYDERQRWEGYWAWRGGTSSNLSGTHPYFASPPTWRRGQITRTNWKARS